MWGGTHMWHVFATRTTKLPANGGNDDIQTGTVRLITLSILLEGYVSIGIL